VVTVDALRRMALALPDAEEKAPAFEVRGVTFVRLLDDGASAAVAIDPDERALLAAADPETFLVTPRYAPYPMMVVRLERVDPQELWALLAGAWSRVAQRPLAAAPRPEEA
jgi:hypothetical protein